MNRPPDNLQSQPLHRTGECPTCGQFTQFTFIGQQQWPPHIAAAAGIEPVVYLWMCGHCQTTLTETALKAAS